MDPARLSITHTADSSMKNVICHGEGGEKENKGDVRTLPSTDSNVPQNAV